MQTDLKQIGKSVTIDAEAKASHVEVQQTHVKFGWIRGVLVEYYFFCS